MNNEPKKLDWIVAAGFVVFMVALITAMVSQNIRWLGGAFVIMTIVISFGLFNNAKNMQPNGDETDLEIYVPDAPSSLKKASGQNSTNTDPKRANLKTMLLFILGTIFFLGLGLFLLFGGFSF